MGNRDFRIPLGTPNFSATFTVVENKSQLEQDSKKLLDAAITERLAMSYEQRIESHENARQLAEELKKAGETLHAKSQSAS